MSDMEIIACERKIQIDDELAKRYIHDWGRIIDERDVIIYMDACFHDGRAYEYLQTMSDSELTGIVEQCMREEL
jgi:transcription termination factor Rho